MPVVPGKDHPAYRHGESAPRPVLPTSVGGVFLEDSVGGNGRNRRAAIDNVDTERIDCSDLLGPLLRSILKRRRRSTSTLPKEGVTSDFDCPTFRREFSGTFEQVDEDLLDERFFKHQVLWRRLNFYLHRSPLVFENP